MRKLYPFRIKIIFLLLCFINLSQSTLTAQTVQITANPGQSGNIVVGTNFYHVSENIYTENEIGASNFTTVGTAINHIDFNVFAVGTVTTVTNFNVYLREVPLDSQVFTTGIYNTAGCKMVYSGTYSPTVTGWVGIDLTTSFVRTNGKNLLLLIERLDNVQHGSFSFRSTNGNDNGSALLTSRRINTATLPVSGTTNLNTASNFRPQIRFRHLFPNDAAINQIYTLGTLPIPFATPHVISANISNNGSLPLTNLNVTLNITGANTFNDVQNIASLDPGMSTTVSFASFSPSSTGSNTVSVSIPSDDFPGDNDITLPQTVSVNAYNYAYGDVPSGQVGVNNNTGDFVAKFTSSSPTSINQVGVNFTAGGQPFKIGIWDKSGNGTPGNLLWESTTQTTTVGLFTLPVSPAVAITDTFYVGVRQIGTTNIQFAYQNETPIRPNTFFSSVPSGNTVWNDFYPGNPFKFMVEPRLTIANDVGVSTLDNPVAAKSLDNCGIVPKVTVSNYGSNDQSSPFDVTYIIKQAGSVVYNDTKQTSLISGESKEISFTPFTGSVSGTDSSFCYTSLPSDGATNNDTLVNAFNTGDFSYGGGAAVNGGYEFANSTTCASPSSFQPTYSWINETSNEINWASNGDDSVLTTPLTLPFSFKYFGTNYTQLWVCSNGWVSFSDLTAIPPVSQNTPVSIPFAAGDIQNYIAGYLNDLDLTTATYSDAHTYYGGDATEFVITYLHAHLKGSADFISFQIILKADGNIFIQYNDAETSSPLPSSILKVGTIGIQNSDGSQGILYRYNGNYGPMFGSPLALQYRPQVNLPVILLSFSATKINGVNQISWSTSQEINSNYFIIERSNDGINFTPLGKITAAGNSNNTRTYSFTDNNPVRGYNYYRLRLVDIDNAAKYSDVRKIRNDDKTDVRIYPNPAKDFMNVIITANKAGTGKISILDNSGKLVYNKSVSINNGENNLEINSAHLPAGIYSIKVQLSDDLIIKKINKL